MNSGEDIFSTLAKYNSTEDENYLTEAFVFLLKHLLEKECTFGLEILDRLCTQDGDFSFQPGEPIDISTQESIPKGAPDITISSPDKRIYIEVKDYSPVDPKQLRKYRADLDSYNLPIKRLILLTRYHVGSKEHKNIPDRCALWREVNDWLSAAQLREPICLYLIDAFKTFLKEKGMSIQQVGWEYINGIPAFNNLMNMLEKAIQDAGIPFSKSAPKGFGWEYKGYSMEGGLWCGIVYSDHLYLIFEIWDKQKYDQTRVKQPTYPVRDNNKSIFFDLIFENVRFFCLDKDKQLEEITKFVKTAYAEAQQMMVK